MDDRRRQFAAEVRGRAVERCELSVVFHVHQGPLQQVVQKQMNECIESRGKKRELKCRRRPIDLQVLQSTGTQMIHYCQAPQRPLQ